MNKHKIIIFDLDGVLLDSIRVAFEFTSTSFPGLTEEMNNELVCGNIHEEIKKLPIARVVETPEQHEKRWKEYAEKKSKLPMFPGTKELLQKLHNSGYILVLNTSARDKNCRPSLEYHNITSLFDFIASAEVSLSKVEKFKLIEEKYQADKSDLLFITDTLGDIREADLAGVPTVAVTWGAHDRSYFGREPHSNLIKIVDSVEELEQVIAG